MSFVKKWGLRIGLPMIALLGLLVVPMPSPGAPEGAGAVPFVWNDDARWSELEQAYLASRSEGCADTEAAESAVSSLEELSLQAGEGERPASDPLLTELEDLLFRVAAISAGCPDLFARYLDATTLARTSVKKQSRGWSMSEREPRETLYRLLYGMRIALEERLLQEDHGDVGTLVLGTNEPSETPSVEVRGVRVHSGDILVSRGGAPTSALIARGSDYPGNFSHIALLHVGDDGTPSIIESHIEVGVVVSSLEQYLEDTKLRIMVLRLSQEQQTRYDDPLLPHRAAARALEETRARHIPYDFEMDYTNSSTQFCSEVASANYAAEGVELWAGPTRMSGTGVVNWLASLGVTHFETHGPSDLEYDPSLVVVAEWRDKETLFQDHLDSAVVDVLLEEANAGEVLSYSWWKLPIARVLKGYSFLLNQFGEEGPIPEGMSATVALRADSFRAIHAERRSRTEKGIADFEAERGYRPPYWHLVRLAEEAAP